MHFVSFVTKGSFVAGHSDKYWLTVGFVLQLSVLLSSESSNTGGSLLSSISKSELARLNHYAFKPCKICYTKFLFES